IGGGAWLALPMLALFAALLFVRMKIPFRRAFTLIAAGMLAASLFFGFAVELRLARLESLAGQTEDIVCTVTEVRYTSSWEGCYTVSTGGMKLNLYSDECELRRGDIIGCTVTYSRHDSTGDIREYLLSDGIVLTAETVGEVSIIEQERGAGAYFGDLRDSLSERLRSVMPEREGGFASALVLGDRRHLDGSITRDFRALGISHIIAVSGTHLAVLFFAVGRLIPERHRRLRAVILCPLILFYLLLTGMPSSVVRAGAMMLIASLAYATNKRSDSITSLSVSATVICLADPMAPFDVGLQLSFASVLGLILSSEIYRKTAVKGRRMGSIIRKLLPSFIVPAVILPLMWLRFGEVSLVSPVANIILVPVATVLVPMIAAVLLLSGINGLFAALCSVLRPIISVFLHAVSVAAAAVDFVLPLSGRVTSVLMILFTATAVTAVLFRGEVRCVFGSVAVALLGVTLLVSQVIVCNSNSGMTACYAAASRDEAICAFSEGCNILVDVGRYPAAADDAATTGLSQGSGRVDALVFTHLHKSHSLTLSSVLAEYYVESIWLPAAVDEDEAEIALRLADTANKQGVSVYMYLPGERLRFGDCDFVAPTADRIGGSTHKRILFELICGDGRLCYSAEPADTDGFAIAATHGANLSEAVFGRPFDGELISPKGAVKAMSVIPGVGICDSAIIRMNGDGVPFVSYSQE
ncbi:MAG: ComEC/Rec2 family competence protein, partial [Clostridia bacterium]|nr:ComEC/Rec2 family competence protein [Clostridia bacterium]